MASLLPLGQKNKRCLNNKDTPFQGFSHRWQKYRETVLVNPKKQPIANLAFILDGYRQRRRRQISYRHIKVKIYPAQKVSVATTANWPTIVKKTGRQLIITVPKENSPYFINNPIKRRLYQLQSRSCNLTLPGQLAVIQALDSFVRLRAQEADSCLSWYFPNLPLNLGWLVRVRTRHQQGYPLSLSLNGANGRFPLLYTKLSDQKDWQDAFFIIPAITHDPFVRGLGVSFDNASFNQQISANDILGLDIVPLNWNYLASIQLIKLGASTVPKSRHYLSARGHYWWYQIKLSATKVGSTLILPQSFSSGWLAFYFRGGRPYFLRHHLLINNWANGWQLPSQSPGRIIIVFWPQALEFIGLGLLAGTIIWLAVPLLFTKKP